MAAPNEKIVCCSCGKALPQNNFYKSYSRFSHNGLMPICKICFKHGYDNYVAEYHSSKKAMQRMCMAFDIYFNEVFFDSCDKDDDKVIGRYMKGMNMTQYLDKTFDTSLEEGFEFSGDRLIQREKRVAVIDQYGNEVEDAKGLKNSDIEKWGTGFEPTDYEMLNAHYKFIKRANPNLNKNQEIFVDDLCYLHVQKMKALTDNRIDDYNKISESYRKTFKQAGLVTEQEDTSQQNDSISEWLGIIASHTPEEYYRDKKRYVDFDGLDTYYRNMIIRPEQNIEHGTSIRDPKYSIPDFDDAEGSVDYDADEDDEEI